MGKFVIILLSVGLILIISAVGALTTLLWGATLAKYLGVFCILTALQLFIGKLWNYYLDRGERLEMEQINSANAMAEAVQHIQCVCEYCGTTNLVKILVGEDNQFECEACQQVNSITLTVSCSRTTNPIMPKAEVAEIFKGIDKK